MTIEHNVLLFLEEMLKKDDEFKKNKTGTVCCDCGQNTFVGRYPFWHRMGRSLCADCGNKYTKLLKKLEAWDE